MLSPIVVKNSMSMIIVEVTFIHTWIFPSIFSKIAFTFIMIDSTFDAEDQDFIWYLFS